MTSPVDAAGVTETLDGGFDLLWERSGAVVSFILVPKVADGGGGPELVWTLP